LFIKGKIDENNYNLLIENNEGDFFKIYMPAKATNITSFTFAVEYGKGIVLGSKKDKEYNNQISFSPLELTENSPSAILRWIGEIKTTHAQKITTDLVGNLSRIGLDQHEWLRAKSKDI